MTLTIVRIYRGGSRAGFVIDHDGLDEFARKLEPLARAIPNDAEWKCFAAPEGMTEMEASRRTI